MKGVVCPMKKMLVTSATKEAPVYSFTCEHCGESILSSVSNKTPHCSVCGFELSPKKGEQVKKDTISASSDKNSLHVVCSHCKEHLVFANSAADTDSECCSIYFCNVCGSGDLVTEEEFKNGNADLNSVLAGMDEGTVSDDDSDDVTDDSDDNGSEVNDDLGNKQAQDETEEDVQVTLDSEGETADPDDLQWLSVDDEENGENGTLIACTKKDAIPLLIFRKNDCPAQMKAHFATNTFLNAFSQIAHKEGMVSAVQKLGGKGFSHRNLISTLGMQAAAYDHMNKHVLPKLVECMALTVEGATKGIYPDVLQSIQASFMQEMIANGLPEDKAYIACQSALGSNTTVFSSILAKALELMNKSPEAFNEVKSTVRASVGLQAATLYDPEQVKTREALNASSKKLVISNSTSSTFKPNLNRDDLIAETRKALNLGRK